MLHQSQRKLVIGLAVLLFCASAALSEVIRPGQKEYVRAMLPQAGTVDVQDEAMSKSALRETSFQALVPTLLGIREVLASLMWVQADDYFHRGEYRPIIKMIRQITLIDPHQIDVYATGAWHMAYNFMDKRLIEDGVKFLEEGCRNNDSVYDLYFELGYMHYDKTKRYDESVVAFENSSTRGTTIPGQRIAPSYVRHLLAHAMEKMGHIDRANLQWEKNLEIATGLIKEGLTGMRPAGSNFDAARHNLYITKRRMNERLAAQAERERDGARALDLWQRNLALADDWLRDSPGHPNVSKDRGVALSQVQRLQSGRLFPVPEEKLDLKFRVTRIAPRKLEIEGKINVLNLSRVHVRFQDAGYAERSAQGLDYKMENCSLEWDNIQVNKQAFKWLLNLDRDPADMGRHPSEIYPLKAAEYDLTLSYNPRWQAAFIQDRYGWSGEGLTAAVPSMLSEDDSQASVMDGRRFPLRIVGKTIRLKLADITGAGKKVLHADY